MSRWAAHILIGAQWPAGNAQIQGCGRANILRHVAAINLKKAPGGAASNMRIIHAHARRDAEFICEQVASTQPDVTVVSGTLWICEDIFGLDRTRRVGQRPCYVLHDLRLGALVRFWHPQA